MKVNSKNRKKKINDERHTHNISLRLTESEYQTIKEKSITAGVTFSEYIRDRAFNYDFKLPPPKEFYDSIKILREISFKLSDMKRANINFKYYDSEKLENDIIHLIADLKEKYL